MNEKLQEIGSKLNVSEEDIKNIQKERFKEKFLYPLVGLIIVAIITIITIISGIVGYCTGYLEVLQPNRPPGGGYPYYPPGCLIAATLTSKKKKFFLVAVAATIISSIIGFIVGYELRCMFATASLYNVYKRENNENNVNLKNVYKR